MRELTHEMLCGQVVHMVPEFGPEHETEDETDCWCEPLVEGMRGCGDTACGFFVKHRAMN